MDKRFHRPEGLAQRTGARLVRYADDFVILARYQGRCISDWIDATVEDWMDLKINPEKTRIVKLSEPGVFGLQLPVRGGPIRACQAVSQPGTQRQSVCA